MGRGDYIDPQTLSWVIEIENRLNRGLPPDVESRRTINRVPSNLRGVHNNAFDPEMIGIGPFNKPWEQEGSSSRLRVMEEHKLRFLNRLLEGKLERHRRDENMWRTTEAERASDDRQHKEDDDGGRTAKAVLLDGLSEAMRSLEQEIKACYSLNFPDRENSRIDYLQQTMVVDGCFVVELFRINYDLLHRRIDWSAIEDDLILTNLRILATLRRDLLLLENQLPFFVLEKLYEVINKKNNIDHQQAVPLEVLAVTFFDPLLLRRYATSEFADLSMVLPFASELEEAGVQFERWKGHGLLGIEFDRRTLRVPPLSLDDDKISLLLNMVVYEQSVNHPEPFFTNYLTFWDSLVNSPRDIQVLHKHGIIYNMGNEEDVAKRGKYTTSAITFVRRSLERHNFFFAHLNTKSEENGSLECHFWQIVLRGFFY